MDDTYKIVCNNCEFNGSIEPCVNCYNNDKFLLNHKLGKTNEIVNNADEINSPPRYNKNGFECIEVMIAIFGKEAVRQFCKLNAFKYIWRESDKGKVNDIKKANYYLKKYVELSSDSSDKR